MMKMATVPLVLALSMGVAFSEGEPAFETAEQESLAALNAEALKTPVKLTVL